MHVALLSIPLAFIFLAIIHKKALYSQLLPKYSPLAAILVLTLCGVVSLRLHSLLKLHQTEQRSAVNNTFNVQ